MYWCHALIDFDSSLCEVDRNCTLGLWEKDQVFKQWIRAFVFRPQSSAVLYSESYYEIRRESTQYALFWSLAQSLQVEICFPVSTASLSHHLPSRFSCRSSWAFSVLNDWCSLVTELFTQIQSHILSQVLRMCICFTQGDRDTFENYYRKQRRKQARLVLQPHSNMVRPHTAWAHPMYDCLSDTLQSYSPPQSLTSPDINSQKLWGKSLALHNIQVYS